MKKVPLFRLGLEFEYWQDDFDLEDEFFNMGVHLEDGRHYALNVWTFKYLERARKEDVESSEGLSASYPMPPDLLIEKLDRDLIQATIADLFRRGLMKAEWLVVEEAPVDVE